MKKTYFQEIGKLGAAKRWATRYEVLVELTKYFGKSHQDELLKWPTKHLVQLLKWNQDLKLNKKN